MAPWTRFLVPGVALAACVAGHPSANRRRLLTVHADVAQPTQVVDLVMFENSAGETTSTGFQSVVVMPTSVPVAAPASVATESAAASVSVSQPQGTSGPSSSSVSGGTAFGVSYAPYDANGDCKTLPQVTSDFAYLKTNFSLVRIYGVSCDLDYVHSAAQATGLNLFVGIYSLDNVDADTDKIAQTFGNDWDMLNTVSVGNELVNDGLASPSQVIGAVQQARQRLRSAGYTGPVVTVDTFDAVEANPELCNESDYCAINAHAFFDSDCPADQAGSWLSATVRDVRSKIDDGKRIVVSETGWPTRGDTNGLAQPGLPQQAAALGSIKNAFAATPADVILFSAFNDLWKTNSQGTFDTEQYWGINGVNSPSDA